MSSGHPPLPEPLAVPVADSHCHLDIGMEGRDGEDGLAVEDALARGGEGVDDAERLKRAAGRIVRAKEAGHDVVAVLSARGKTTDELVSMAEEVSITPDPREMDMLLSTGERISCALCAMAINDLGHRAISLTGSQAGIVTDTPVFPLKQLPEPLPL